MDDRAELKAERTVVRQVGDATDNEERVLGMRRVAAPIRKANDERLGVISVSGLTNRFTDPAFDDEIPTPPS